MVASNGVMGNEINLNNGQDIKVTLNYFKGLYQYLSGTATCYKNYAYYRLMHIKKDSRPLLPLQ